MRLFVGVTDDQWFHFLARQTGCEEVNFWRPSGTGFQALGEGELFLFKLHAPHHFIVGGGFFARALQLPLSLAWDSFGTANGVRDLPEMRRKIAKYRHEFRVTLGSLISVLLIGALVHSVSSAEVSLLARAPTILALPSYARISN